MTDQQHKTISPEPSTYQKAEALWTGRVGESVRALASISNTSGGFNAFAAAYARHIEKGDTTIGQLALELLAVLREQIELAV